MLLYWYTCISINTDLHIVYNISLETFQWALSNESLIIWICLAIYEILTNKAFTITNSLISWLFVIAFIYPTYV